MSREEERRMPGDRLAKEVKELREEMERALNQAMADLEEINKRLAIVRGLAVQRLKERNAFARQLADLHDEVSHAERRAREANEARVEAQTKFDDVLILVHVISERFPEAKETIERWMAKHYE
jgi:chromosome segregation ATPase